MTARPLRRVLLAACAAAAVVGCGPESNEDYFNRTAPKGVEGPPQTYGSGAGNPSAAQSSNAAPADAAAPAEGDAAKPADAPAPEAAPTPAPAPAPPAEAPKS